MLAFRTALAANRSCAPYQLLAILLPASITIEAGERFEVLRYHCGVWPERSLINSQRLLQKRLGLGVAFHFVVSSSEVTEHDRHVRMVLAKHAAADLEGALVQRFGVCIPLLRKRHLAEVVADGGYAERARIAVG